MDDKLVDLLEGMSVLSDEDLEAVAGGMTDGDRATLTRFMKDCKISGYSLSDALALLQRHYSRFPDQLSEYVDYVCEIW